MNEDKIKDYKTDNLGIASYIQLKGGKLLNIKLNPEQQFRYYFIFEDSDKCTKLQYDYLNDVDRIRTLFDIREALVKQVKSLQNESN